MLFPFLKSSAKGGIFYEGQVDVERGDKLSNHNCMLNGTITMWMSAQNLTKLALVSLGNNENTTFPNNQSWLGLFKGDFLNRTKGQINYLSLVLPQIKGQIK